MNHAPFHSFVSLLFTGLILLAAFSVLQPFLLAAAWAVVIAIASWPLHRRIRKRLPPQREGLAAGVSTALVFLMLVAPMAALLTLVAQEIYSIVERLVAIDRTGAPPPTWLVRVPGFSEQLIDLWQKTLGEPEQLSRLLKEWAATEVDNVQSFAQSVLVGLSTRIITLFFAVWILFFIYRDGETLIARINAIGYRWLERRWPSYAANIPLSLRAAVNGLVIVAIAEAALLSAMFQSFGVPSAVLLGVLTATVAFIPLAAPLLLGLIGGAMFLQGTEFGGLFIFVFGTALVLFADYFIRPLLIQGATHLPFLAILFGILGGVATMGILGLIIGPVILVLFVVLLREAASEDRSESEF